MGFGLKLSELRHRSVVDTDGVKVGKVADVWLDDDGSVWLVVGGGFIEETLEKLHIRPNIDPLVPMDWVERIEGDGIVLTVSSLELESTCQECWVREKEHLQAVATTHPNPDAVLRLGYPRV